MNELNLILKRIFKGEKYTIGHLYCGEDKICDTLEDRVRDLTKEEKVYAETAIPAGRYNITLEESPKFKRELPYLHDVPQFTGILIHAGNTAEDSAGCILVGENKVKGKVVNSRYWEEEIKYMILDAIDNGLKVYITIE